MKPSEIRLSIALLTRNRPDSLNRCLQSLRSQNRQPFEVVISDDSDPQWTNAIKEVADRWDCRYIKGSQRGLYANRNHAALACHGTHIRTMDDDHILPPGHLQQCLDAIAIDPQAIWTTGELGFIDGKFYKKVAVANQLSASGTGIGITNPDNNWGIADGSTIYPRLIYDRGFRAIEEYNYGESYLEFGAYLYMNGFHSRCISGAYIEHYAESETITRRPVSMYESRLYSSICYNLYLQRNYCKFLRYLASYSFYLGKHKNLLFYLPDILAKVRSRWEKSTTNL
ncbi:MULTISPECIES: glycosyltransferase family 2 protein [Spirulina sp. CCY15215]|uniref:glycosyltransferase family 2 protein n=1 Tax=Spirulina sp. CCY15215 TaxID=2767591 RepID=UPI00194F1984|nr:glycosyltransferase family 2 protein [Spirulina major]